jgi:hypothetical protein
MKVLQLLILSVLACVQVGCASSDDRADATPEPSMEPVQSPDPGSAQQRDEDSHGWGASVSDASAKASH